MAFRPALLLALALVPGPLLSGCTEAGAAELSRGHVLAARRQYGEALEAYRAAAEARPRSARPRELLGHLLYRQGKPAEARAAYEDALRVEPRGAVEAEIGLARLEADAGQLDGALERLGGVLQRQPGNLHALLSRANLGLRRGREADVALALDDTARALALDARSESVLFARAQALLAARRLDEAAQGYALLHKAHPRSALAAYGEARLAAVRGDKTAALERLGQARQRARESGTWRADEAKADPAFQAFKDDPEFVTAVNAP